MASVGWRGATGRFAGAVVSLIVVVSCGGMDIWFSIWIWRVERCWSNLMMNLLSSWRKSPRYEVRVGPNCFDGGLAQSLRLRNWLLLTRSFLRRIGVSPQILRWFNLRFRSRPEPCPRGNAQ